MNHQVPLHYLKDFYTFVINLMEYFKSSIKLEYGTTFILPYG